MTKVLVKNVKVQDLPLSLREGLDAQPEDVVRVTVNAEHSRLVDELIVLADRIGREAERRGLTDEKLERLLKDERR